MRCFVTGASGFIGANLVHELVARGHRVKALTRLESDLRGLKGADFERINGDVSDREKLVAAMRGCDWCFHVAASYHLWLRDYAPMYAANLQGTRNVLEAAAQAGCSRIVYTSTVGCIGLPSENRNVGASERQTVRVPERGSAERPERGSAERPERQSVIPTDETATVSEEQMSNHYKRSKWQAEQVELELARKGLPVVIVNPRAPIGPRDVKPTPTGKVTMDS